MRIAFFGSSLLSSYWNGAATYYRGILRALHDRGHEITFYEPDAFNRMKHRDHESVPYARSVIYSADETSAAEQLRAARHADVVIKASGVGVLDEFLERGALDLASHGRRVYFWDVDAPATLERITADEQDPFRSLIPEYSGILTYGGGAPVIERYTSLGARFCAPIYNALDPDTHFPAAADERFRGAAGFLGNRLPDREARVRSFFFEPARSLRGHRFVRGGEGWGGAAADIPNLSYVGHVYCADHNSFNSSVKAVVNISRDSMARFGHSPATRVFEAAGAAACIITDRWEGLEKFLEPDHECLAADDGTSVAAIVANLPPERAREIGERARRRVLSEHTYAHRAAQAESCLLEGGVR